MLDWGSEKGSDMQSKNNIICPYCGTELATVPEELFQRSDRHWITCGACGKEFEVRKAKALSSSASINLFSFRTITVEARLSGHLGARLVKQVFSLVHVVLLFALLASVCASVLMFFAWMFCASFLRGVTVNFFLLFWKCLAVTLLVFLVIPVWRVAYEVVMTYFVMSLDIRDIRESLCSGVVEVG